MVKKKIDAPERRQWLEAADAGRPISDIAREFRRDARAVKKAIEKARAERAKSQARQQLLVKAWEEHNKELLAEAKALQAAIEFPAYRDYSFSVVQPADEGASRLRKALRSHTRGTTLWRVLTALEKTGSHYEDSRLKLKDGVYERMARDTRGLVADVMEGFAETAFIRAMSVAIHKANHLEGFAYKIERSTDGRWTLKLESFPLAVADSREVLTTIRERHKSFLEEVGSWKELDQIAELSGDMNRLKQRIDGSVETLVLKRVLPGECPYCPG